MAKKRSIMPENNEEQIVPEVEPALEFRVNPELVLRNPNSKLNLTMRNGSRRLLTLEEALLERNYKQLTEATKALLKKGKTASQIVRENTPNE